MTPKATQNKQIRAAETGTFLFDEEWTRAALLLANTDIQSQAQATDLFRKSAKGRAFFSFAAEPDGLTTGESIQRNHEKRQAVLGAKEYDDALTFDTDDWEIAQQWLQRWLPKIAEADRLPESSDAALRREISRMLLASGDISLRLGRRDLILSIQHDSIFNTVVRAVIPFLVPYGWSPRRIGKCELNSCRRWFLRENKSGPPEQYCCKEHGTLARVRRFRGKQA